MNREFWMDFFNWLEVTGDIDELSEARSRALATLEKVTDKEVRGAVRRMVHHIDQKIVAVANQYFQKQG